MKFVNKPFTLAFLITLAVFNNLEAQVSNINETELVIVTDGSVAVNIDNPEHDDIQVTVKVEKIDFEAPTTFDQLVHLINTKKIKTQEQLLTALKYFPELKEVVQKAIQRQLKTDADFIRYIWEISKTAREQILKLVKLINDKQHLRTLMA